MFLLYPIPFSAEKARCLVTCDLQGIFSGRPPFVLWWWGQWQPKFHQDHRSWLDMGWITSSHLKESHQLLALALEMTQRGLIGLCVCVCVCYGIFKRGIIINIIPIPKSVRKGSIFWHITLNQSSHIFITTALDRDTPRSSIARTLDTYTCLK